jgi:hypothetical protein
MHAEGEVEIPTEVEGVTTPMRADPAMTADDYPYSSGFQGRNPAGNWRKCRLILTPRRQRMSS